MKGTAVTEQWRALIGGFWQVVGIGAIGLFVCVVSAQDAEVPVPETPAVENEPASSSPAPTPLQELPPAEDILHLVNGDILAGQLIAGSPDDGMRWRHHVDVDEAVFEFGSVKEVDLEVVDRVQVATGENGRVRLSNGDVFAGRLSGVDKDSVVLSTWYGGELRFPRDRWQWIVFEDEPVEPLFAGPKQRDGWTIGDVSMARVQSGHWVFHEGAFYATKAASIARDLDLPDRSRIEFQLHWKGTLNLAFALYTDYLHPVSLANKDTEPDFGGFYSLQLNSYFANVLMVKQKVPLQYLGQVQTPAFAKKRSAHIDIRVDKANDSVALIVDGVLVKQWVDKTGFAGEGSGVRMVHQGQGAIRFSDFKLSPWNGQFDEPPTLRATAQEDLVTLRNGDKLIGTVRTIKDGILDFALIGGQTKLPIGDVKKIELAGVPNLKKAPAPGPNPVASHFSDQEVLHFQLSEVVGNRIRGVSPNFGPVDMDLRAFTRLSMQEQ